MREDPEGNERRLKMKELRGKSRGTGPKRKSASQSGRAKTS
jgi:hypothetical protein